MCWREGRVLRGRGVCWREGRVLEGGACAAREGRVLRGRGVCWREGRVLRGRGVCWREGRVLEGGACAAREGRVLRGRGVCCEGGACAAREGRVLRGRGVCCGGVLVSKALPPSGTLSRLVISGSAKSFTRASFASPRACVLRVPLIQFKRRLHCSLGLRSVKPQRELRSSTTCNAEMGGRDSASDRREAYLMADDESSLDEGWWRIKDG